MLRATVACCMLLSVVPGIASAQRATPASAPTPDSSATADSTKTRLPQLARVRILASSARSRYGTTRTRTATRTDTPLRDTPQSASVIPSALITDQAMQSMADVVRYVPGITMGQGEGHRDAPTIRGNSSTADFFVDGVRDDAQYLRDLYDAERVEALKGANAMVFGRGGGGGIVNRVSKEASWAPIGSLTLEGGSFAHKRGTIDAGTPLGDRFAVRVNGLLERSAGFRDATLLRRNGLHPTASLVLGTGTIVKLGYEGFADDRTVDRGIPSFQGRPSSTPVRTFFGDPDSSRSHARVDAADALIEHSLGASVTLRNRTRLAHYDKFYQNVYPGAVDASGRQVALSAYNHATRRANLFNQMDLVASLATRRLTHVLLAGSELSRQQTENVRNTGYFGGSAMTTLVPFDQPRRVAAVAFRQSATDADNTTDARVSALYAQDHVTISPHLQAIVGLRVDEFALRFHNRRAVQDLRRTDRMVSPRYGVIVKPRASMSLYGAYSVSQLPSSGDQFSSLTPTTEALSPERFTNRELGVKWDVSETLALSAATFRLDRTNSSAKDPADPARVLQTGAQRTSGVELGIMGAIRTGWEVAGGYSAQRAEIVSATTASVAGATVPLVPHHSLSLWNKVQLTHAGAGGVGVVHQAGMYASIDNTVILPAFTRVDAAFFYVLTPRLRGQLNVENILDTRYYSTSHGNNNIMPGSTRTVRVGMTAGR